MIMSNARKLSGKSFGISADFPKEIMERRKRKMQQYKKAKADGKQVLFSKAEPDKLFIGGVQVQTNLLGSNSNRIRPCIIFPLFFFFYE